MLKEKILQMSAISDRIPMSLDIRLHMCGTTYPNRNYMIQRPQSRVTCIEYIVAGSGEVHAQDTCFRATAGDTYFLPMGIDHHYFSDRKEPWEKVWINLSGSGVEQLARIYGVSETYHYPQLDTADIFQKLQYHAEHADSPNAAEKCISLVNELFFRMAQSLCRAKEAANSPVQLMLNYIEQHQTESIRLEQLAAVCGKSPSQTERLFRAELGIPPYRFVLNRKIELACSLLTETGMSVRDIAAYLSFDDEFYFSGLFRRKTGFSPTQYRKKHTVDQKKTP